MAMVELLHRSDQPRGSELKFGEINKIVIHTKPHSLTSLCTYLFNSAQDFSLLECNDSLLFSRSTGIFLFKTLILQLFRFCLPFFIKELFPYGSLLNTERKTVYALFALLLS